MTSRNTFTRFVAAALVVTLHLLFVPAPAEASVSEATVSGNILSWEDQAPISGAVVHATDPASTTSFASSPADAEGNFEIAGLPPSSYVLAVEADGGLYVVGTPVKLAAGESRAVQLALNPSLAPAASQGMKTSWKNNPATAALMVIGGAVLLGLLINEIDDSDEPFASASLP